MIFTILKQSHTMKCPPSKEKIKDLFLHGNNNFRVENLTQSPEASAVSNLMLPHLPQTIKIARVPAINSSALFYSL